MITSCDGRGHESVGVWVADLASNRAEKATPESEICGHPSWSPDATKIVYFRNPAKTAGPYFPPWDVDRSHYAPRDLWFFDLSDGATVPLTDDARDNERPAWSPDGRCVAYVSGDGEFRDLWVTEIGGGVPRRLTDGRTIFYRPAWRPDGRCLAFNNKGPGDHYLWTVALDGGAPERLTGPAEGRQAVHDHGAFWSADGKDILFHSDRGGPWGLWVIGADGANPRPIAMQGLPHAGHGSWDRRERWIGFDAKPA